MYKVENSVVEDTHLLYLLKITWLYKIIIYNIQMYKLVIFVKRAPNPENLSRKYMYSLSDCYWIPSEH